MLFNFAISNDLSYIKTTLSLEIISLKRLWMQYRFIFWIAKHFALMTSLARLGYRLNIWRRRLNNKQVRFVSQACKHSQEMKPHQNQLIYVPSCGGQIASLDKQPPAYYIEQLCAKAGFELIIPGPIRELCCGRVFSHYNQLQAAEFKQRQLNRATHNASSAREVIRFSDSIACAAFSSKLVEPSTKALVGGIELIDQCLLKSLCFYSIVEHTLFIVSDLPQQQQLQQLLVKMYHSDLAMLTHIEQLDDALDNKRQPANIAIFTFLQLQRLLQDAASNYMLKVKWQIVFVQSSHELLFQEQALLNGHHVQSFWYWLDQFSSKTVSE